MTHNSQCVSCASWRVIPLSTLPNLAPFPAITRGLCHWKGWVHQKWSASVESGVLQSLFYKSVYSAPVKMQAVPKSSEGCWSFACMHPACSVYAQWEGHKWLLTCNWVVLFCLQNFNVQKLMRLSLFRGAVTWCKVIVGAPVVGY